MWSKIDDISYEYDNTGWKMVYTNGPLAPQAILGPTGQFHPFTKRFDLYTALDIAEAFITGHALKEHM